MYGVRYMNSDAPKTAERTICSMLASERRMYIMDQLNQKSIVSLKEIAAELAISEITVRRDFEKLENAGKLIRVQGGAALEGYLDNVELTMKEKVALHPDAKSRVARHAASYVREGDCVFLDGGSTITPLVKFLAGMQIKIVTYSELVVRELSNPTATIHVIGGVFLPQYVMNVGPEAQEALRRYHFDVAFFGCSGVELAENMSYISNMDSLLIKQIALENSAKKLLLLDSSKINRPSFLRFRELDAFDRIICDRPQGESISHERMELV